LTQGVRRHRAAAAEYRRELHRSIVRHGENGRG
jgi:hypothetical protein